MAYRRVTVGFGKVLDARTYAQFQYMEDMLGVKLTILQGSFSKAVSVSGGTHDGSGALDISVQDLARKGVTIEQVVRAGRLAGLAMWYRPTITGLWSKHIHGISIGSKGLSPTAAAQVEAYKDGYNGLGHLGRGGPDDGPKVPYVVWEDVNPVRPAGKPPLALRGLWKGGARRPAWTKYLQQLLNSQGGPQLVLDGVYSRKTADRVKLYKKRHGIRPATGVTGSRVWKSLGVK